MIVANNVEEFEDPNIEEGDPPIEDDTPVDDIPGDGPEFPYVQEKDWSVEITITSRKYNDLTPQANILTENKIVTRDVVSDSRLLEILNFVQPKTEI